MKLGGPKLLAVALVSVSAVIGLVAGRALWDSVVAQGQPKVEPTPDAVTAEDPPTAIGPLEEAVRAEEAKPKFQGEVNGIFIAPLGAQVPDKYVTHEEICGLALTKQVGWDQAGQFDLHLELPPPFVLDAQSLNTGVIACEGTVYAARWNFLAKQPNGYLGSLVIARSPFKSGQFDASAERVLATEIGGLPAVVIKPLIPNGIGSAAGVIFPGDAVTTSIQSYGVPETDLLVVAEIVAAEIKKRST